MIGRREATLAGRAGFFGLVLGAVALLTLSLATAAWAAKEYELNDSRETAYGPLAGATWYTAGFETVNDIDWYVFYVKSYSQVEFSATMAQPPKCDAYFLLYDRDGNQVNEYREYDLRAESSNAVAHLPLTMDPGRYYITASGCQGDRYKFRIDPPASLTTSRECGEAIVTRDVATPQLAAVNEDLAKVNGVLATRAEAVHEAKGAVRRASAKVKRLKERLGRARHPYRRRALRSQLRQARGVAQNARERLDQAKERRRPVWGEKRDLETIAQQHNQQIAAANGQIATFC